MAPRENGGFAGDRIAAPRPVDSLLRALLYIAQQIGRPLSEADVRRLVGVSGRNLDERAFLTAGARLGLQARAVPLDAARLNDLALPFAVTGGDRPAHVVVSGKDAQWTVLDVVNGRVWQAAPEEIGTLGNCALIMCEPPVDQRARPWHAALLARLRPAILKIAGVTLLICLLGLATPIFTMLVVNLVVGRDPPADAASLTMALCGGMLVVYGLDLALRVMRSRLSARAGGKLGSALSLEMVHHLLQLPQRSLDGMSSGAIAETLRDVGVLRAILVGDLPIMAMELVFATFFLGATFALSARLGLAATFAIPILVGWAIMAQRRQRRLVGEDFASLAASSSLLSETLANAATIKALGLEAEVEKRWQARIEEAARIESQTGLLNDLIANGSTGLLLVVSLAIIGLGAYEVLDHRLTIGAVIAANMLAIRALQPTGQAFGAWRRLQAVVAAFKRVDALMTEAVESPAGAQAPAPPLAGEVTLECVSYRIDEHGPAILQEATLEIPAGEVLGIVGPSGSGKSTIAHLVQGLVRPSHGRVLIDGNDVRHLPLAQLRAQIGTVPQGSQLFTGSVLANIAMGVEDKDPGRVMTVAKFVGAHDFIQRLPRGYDTVLMERGQGLSAGQRQLICIARALIRNPRILILDEATGTLDPASEEHLLRQLKASTRGRTVILISHRLAPLAIADRIAFVMEGRIERVGPPAELMAHARIRMAEAACGQSATVSPAARVTEQAMAGQLK